MCDLISRQDAIRLAEQGQIQGFEWQFKKLCELPSAEPEEASVILGTSKDGVRLWYKCSVCGEPANADDNYCCNCGRKFINGRFDR